MFTPREYTRHVYKCLPPFDECYSWTADVFKNSSPSHSPYRRRIAPSWGEGIPRSVFFSFLHLHAPRRYYFVNNLFCVFLNGVRTVYTHLCTNKYVRIKLTYRVGFISKFHHCLGAQRRITVRICFRRSNNRLSDIWGQGLILKNIWRARKWLWWYDKKCE